MGLTFDKLPDGLETLEKQLARREAEKNLKSGTNAKIIWNDEYRKARTPCAMVYLHGFSASRGDGDPVHKDIAQKLGCNLYLARLYGHGLQQNRPFGDLSSQKLMKSAQEALAVGRKIGDRVVVMASSAGGLLALYLASLPALAPHIAGLVLFSPLVHFYGVNAVLLEHTFSRNLLHLLPGPDYLIRTGRPKSKAEKNIWYQNYQLQGALALGGLVQQLVKSSLFQSIGCPVFTGYYCKNNHRHDRVVSTAATQRMMRMLGTAHHLVETKNFPQAGTHVISSPLFSRSVDVVSRATYHFLKQKITISDG